MPTWTPEQVLALAPDASSASSGQGLASTRKWQGLGRSDRAVWGLCQGSGKKPYETRVDLSEPAFKCTCPSRKFPCKHGIGLMLIFAKDGASIPEAEEPGWVAEWLAGREERAEKKVERANAAADKPVDAAAQAKRAAQRGARVDEGVASCRTWLEDLVRRGLAAAQGESAATWDRMAARMVDAQAPGLGTFIRRIPELIGSGRGWDVRTLDHLGRLHLLLRAWERLAELPDDLAGDVRTALGWNQSKEDLGGGPRVADRWVVAAQNQEEEQRLRIRRTWLFGRASSRRALLLDFAAGAAPMERGVVSGSEFDAELAFYPSRLPLRAVIMSRGEASPISGPAVAGAGTKVGEALRGYAMGLAANPWLARWPMLLAEVRLVRDGEAWYLVDGENAGLPLHPSCASGLSELQLWRMLSASGGRAMTVCAEWDGEAALPLGAVFSGDYLDVGPRWAA
jgi:hypothetical protein